MNKTAFKEKLMHAVFLFAACFSILAVVLICIFLFANGIPAIAEIGALDFLLGKTWRPSEDIYGILPMILGSIYVTAGAVPTNFSICTRQVLALVACARLEVPMSSVSVLGSP